MNNNMKIPTLQFWLDAPYQGRIDKATPSPYLRIVNRETPMLFGAEWKCENGSFPLSNDATHFLTSFQSYRRPADRIDVILSWVWLGVSHRFYPLLSAVCALHCVAFAFAGKSVNWSSRSLCSALLRLCSPVLPRWRQTGGRLANCPKWLKLKCVKQLRTLVIHFHLLTHFLLRKPAKPCYPALVCATWESW